MSANVSTSTGGRSPVVKPTARSFAKKVPGRAEGTSNGIWWKCPPGPNLAATVVPGAQTGAHRSRRRGSPRRPHRRDGEGGFDSYQRFTDRWLPIAVLE